MPGRVARNAGVQSRLAATQPRRSRMDLKLEVVPIPVTDVDAAKAFYTEQVGFHLDHDVRPDERMRVVQMTPPGSACSVVIGEGLPLGEPGVGQGGPAKCGGRRCRARDACRTRSRGRSCPAARARGNARIAIRVLPRSGRKRVGRARAEALGVLDAGWTCAVMRPRAGRVRSDCRRGRRAGSAGRPGR